MLIIDTKNTYPGIQGRFVTYKGIINVSNLRFDGVSKNYRINFERIRSKVDIKFKMTLDDREILQQNLDEVKYTWGFDNTEFYWYCNVSVPKGCIVYYEATGFDALLSEVENDNEVVDLGTTSNNDFSTFHNHDGKTSSKILPSSIDCKGYNFKILGTNGVGQIVFLDDPITMPGEFALLTCDGKTVSFLQADPSEVLPSNRNAVDFTWEASSGADLYDIDIAEYQGGIGESPSGIWTIVASANNLITNEKLNWDLSSACDLDKLYRINVRAKISTTGGQRYCEQMAYFIFADPSA